MGGKGIFEPREFFFRYQIPCMNFFLGHSMNIFLGLIGVHEFFSFNFPLREYFFFVLRLHPAHKFSNGPPLSLIQISSQGRSVAEIKDRKNGGSDLQRMVARTQKKI